VPVVKKWHYVYVPYVAIPLIRGSCHLQDFFKAYGIRERETDRERKGRRKRGKRRLPLAVKKKKKVTF
jgi:hypothetical protein